MEEAALVVLPYREIESSGVLATALGHGRPAVVTDVGSLGDTVRELDAGAVVPPEDAGGARRGVRRAAPRSAAGSARRGLSWDRAAEAHERLYAELLEERG